jgi:hypothetical protein
MLERESVVRDEAEAYLLLRKYVTKEGLEPGVGLHKWRVGLVLVSLVRLPPHKLHTWTFDWGMQGGVSSHSKDLTPKLKFMICNN